MMGFWVAIISLAKVSVYDQRVRWADQYYRVSPGARAAIATNAATKKRNLMEFENTFGENYYYDGPDSSHWTVNGKKMNYADVDCSLSPGWIQKLDNFPDIAWSYNDSNKSYTDPSLIGYESVCAGETTSPACALICLPYQAGVSGPQTQTGAFMMPATPEADGTTTQAAPLKLAQKGYDVGYLAYGYAAPDPTGAGPICETYVKDCQYSTAETRTFNKGGVEMKYPRHDPIGFGRASGDGGAEDGQCSKSDAATQWLDCGIPCPAPWPMKNSDLKQTFGVAVIVFIAFCSLIGLIAVFKVGKKTENYFVAGRSLNIFVVVATLGSQALDANASLGNLDLGYFYHWWDGACLPIGLGASLILNGIFFAGPLNKLKLLTLPDLMSVKFGPACELLFSVLSIVSFLCLLAGNLVGSGKIVSHLFFKGDDEVPGIWICALCVWLYTVAGGLFSVAFTDIGQAFIGWIGMLVGAAWVMNNMPEAAGASPAYPLGDSAVFEEGMSDKDSYDPIPNAIMLNWATVIVLAFGNLGALDFQARVFASKGPKTAIAGCLIAGCITFIVGVPFAYISGATRALYGPSSPYAEFVADSCSRHITVLGCFGPGVPAKLSPGDDRTGTCNAIPLHTPTCGEWKPDPYAPLKLLTCTNDDCHLFIDYLGDAGVGAAGTIKNFPMNGFIGGWILLAIVAASMSTGDGAILAMSTVLAHNILSKTKVTEGRKLTVTRISTLLWAAISAGIASGVPGQTAYLLIVAFDIMLAGCVVPMFAAVYWKKCKPLAAFVAMLVGSLVRLILEFALPKDGLLLLVGTYAQTFAAGLYEYDDFKKFTNWDVVTAVPNATDYTTTSPLGVDEACPQRDVEDWTGVDSLISPMVSMIVLLIGQLVLPQVSNKAFSPAGSIEADKETATEQATA